MTQGERMLAGKLYLASDPALRRAHDRARDLTRRYNDIAGRGPEGEALLRELLGGVGADVWIEPPFRCDYGANIRVGSRFYANFDCIILDVCPVTIGDNVLLGPRVGIYTAAHPLDPAQRRTGAECGAPVTIGDDVWIGGNAVICPGVTVGAGSVIGAGSVVTRDIPGHVVAAGNPCRVLRPLGGTDRARWREELAELGLTDGI